jgi:hypothetical protein
MTAAILGLSEADITALAHYAASRGGAAAR